MGGFLFVSFFSVCVCVLSGLVSQTGWSVLVNRDYQVWFLRQGGACLLTGIIRSGFSDRVMFDC